MPTARFTLARLIEDPALGFRPPLGLLQSSTTIVSSNMILWKFTNTLQSYLIYYWLVKSISLILLKWQKHSTAFCGDGLSSFCISIFKSMQLQHTLELVNCFVFLVNTITSVHQKLQQNLILSIVCIQGKNIFKKKSEKTWSYRVAISNSTNISSKTVRNSNCVICLKLDTF